MSKTEKILIIFVSVLTFFLVYTPHLNYPMPLHIDEWHHIAEGLRMGNYGEYFNFLKLETTARSNGIEIGFHFILFLLSGIVNLVSVYKFLPALWAVFSGLVLFYVVHKKTDENFPVALLAMIFFASMIPSIMPVP